MTVTVRKALPARESQLHPISLMRPRRIISFSRPACIPEPEHPPFVQRPLSRVVVHATASDYSHKGICLRSLYITSYDMGSALYPRTAAMSISIGGLPPKMSDPTVFLRLLDVRFGVYQALGYRITKAI
jgi:hypothetical protein